MADCLFCDIIAGKIPCEEVYSDEEFLGFRDIAPQAPTHVLLIPRRHIAALADLVADDADLMGRMVLAATRIAASEGCAEAGYRFVVNCGTDGGQLVGHLHLHILAGRALRWPPG